VSHQERTVLFACQEDHLVGILAEPAGDTLCGDVGLVVIVGGPQYRAGSHRQFLQLSRSLAEVGIPVLRFDVRGMGDSTGEPHDFEHITPDIGAAIDALQTHAPQLRRVVLWGLCDGASAALLYLAETKDARVKGLCLLNPWVRSTASLARTQVKHYYLQRLLQRAFWAKLIRGGVAFDALAGLLRNVRVAVQARGMAVETSSAGDETSGASTPYQNRMLAGWRNFSGRILMILSSEDYTAKEFLEYCAADPTWSKALAMAQVKREDVAGADHTFSNHADRAIVEASTLAALLHFGRPPT
jgi:exosortase A-associated hydrolase 1